MVKIVRYARIRKRMSGSSIVINYKYSSMEDIDFIT